MADEPEVQPETPTAPAEQLLEEDFDWDKFFGSTGTSEPAPTMEAAPPTPPAPEPTAEEDLRAQLAKAQADSARALEIATQAQTQSKMHDAIEAWKQQASPAELELAPILMDSGSPEELRKNAEIVKKAAAKLDSTGAEREARARKEMELKMQQEYGMPIPPTFQAIPEAERVKDLLKEGNLEDAAATMMKGFM